MSRLTRRARRQEPLTRFQIGADVLVEMAAGIVLRLDSSPEGEDGRAVTVLVHPDVSPPLAVAEMRMLADELEESIVYA